MFKKVSALCVMKFLRQTDQEEAVVDEVVWLLAQTRGVLGLFLLFTVVARKLSIRSELCDAQGMVYVVRRICYLGSLSPKAGDEYCVLADVRLFRQNWKATLKHLTDVFSVTKWEESCTSGSCE